jgi:hypothetical protein
VHKQLAGNFFTEGSCLVSHQEDHELELNEAWEQKEKQAEYVGRLENVHSLTLLSVAALTSDCKSVLSLYLRLTCQFVLHPVAVRPWTQRKI